MSHYLTGNETKARLLESAGEVFAEYGFRHAKVQDICHRAKANVAAINYHFGGKEQLYQAVILHAIDADETFLSSLAGTPGASPDVRLRQFITAFLMATLSSENPAWHGKLLSHELSDPTPAIDLVIEHLVRPIHNTLFAIINELLGADANPDDAEFLTVSVLGQCVIYHHAKEVVVRMNPELRFDAASLDALAGRITRFSLNAIRRYSANATDKE